MSPYYIAGVIFGIVLALTIAAVAYVINKRKTGGTKYDERQMVGRGKAFQAGFFTLLMTNALISILEFAADLPGEVFLWHMLAIFISVDAFVLVAIHYDAYISMTDTPKRFMKMGVILAVAMAVSAAGNLMADQPSNHTLGYINLMLAADWVLILAAMAIHNRKKASTEEEE